MPRDSNGVFSLPGGYLGTTGETILTSQHNPPLEDIRDALTGSLARNGGGGMLANLPMGGFRITGLAAGTGSGDAATVAQIGTFKKLVETIKTDNYTVLAADAGTMLIGNKATALTFALPAASTVSGSAFPFRNIGVGALTLDPNSAETIEGVATLVLQTGDAAIIWSNGTVWRALIFPKIQNPVEAFVFAVTDEDTPIATGVQSVSWHLPYAFTLLQGHAGLRATVSAQQTSGSLFTVDVKIDGTTILSTLLTIDNNEYSSVDAVAPVISSLSLPDSGRVTVQVTQVGNSTAKGLKLYFIGRRT